MKGTSRLVKDTSKIEQQIIKKIDPVKWLPHKYQGKAKRFILNNMVAGLFLSPGLGKTSITLAAIAELKKKGYVNKVLLIAPLRVCHSVWPAEIEKWANFNHLKAVVLHGKYKEALLEEDADIYIINPEGLKWLLGVTKTPIRNRQGQPTGKTKIDYDWWRWRNFGFDTLVIDELSKFKHWSSDRFKMINLVRDTFSRRWGLTGSPAANGLMDLFGQIKTLDGGRSLGPYITQYREEFFDVDHSGFVYTLKPGANEIIYKRIAPLVMQMKARDYLELPMLVENNIYVDLPPKARGVYNMMQELLIAEIDSKILTAQTAAVKSMKCRQLASGAVFTNDVKEITGFVLPTGPREWVTIHDEKLDALEDLIDELQGSPLLVAYEFEHDLIRLKERLGKNIPHIGSGVSATKGRDIERAWNAGEIPVLLGQPQSMGHGLNLQGSGNNVCWFTLTWNFENYEQLIQRVLRQGNKNAHVFVHHILAKDTVEDRVVLPLLKQKEHTQHALFKGLQKLRR